MCVASSADISRMVRTQEPHNEPGPEPIPNGLEEVGDSIHRGMVQGRLLKARQHRRLKLRRRETRHPW